jgi:anaphase-promoting complex subunit 6
MVNIGLLIYLYVLIEEVNDIYNMALVYYQQQEFERALTILNKKDTLNKSVKCRYLAALCSVSGL